jgi:hypothetical protein
MKTSYAHSAWAHWFRYRPILRIGYGTRMTDALHEAAQRLINPEPEPTPWWIVLALPVGLPMLAVYWLFSLLPLPPRSGGLHSAAHSD